MKQLYKAEALELLKLLSALESWSFSSTTNLPDYLLERLAQQIDDLTKIILEE